MKRIFFSFWLRGSAIPGIPCYALKTSRNRDSRHAAADILHFFQSVMTWRRASYARRQGALLDHAVPAQAAKGLLAGHVVEGDRHAAAISCHAEGLSSTGSFIRPNNMSSPATRTAIRLRSAMK